MPLALVVDRRREVLVVGEQLPRTACCSLATESGVQHGLRRAAKGVIAADVEHVAEQRVVAVGDLVPRTASSAISNRPTPSMSSPSR